MTHVALEGPDLLVTRTDGTPRRYAWGE